VHEVTKHNNFRLPSLPSRYIVQIELFSQVRKIKLNKFVGEDGILHKILKEMSFYMYVTENRIILIIRSAKVLYQTSGNFQE